MLCNGNEVVLFDVLRTCDYLHKLAFADIYLCDEHMVGVGVALYLLYLTDNDI